MYNALGSVFARRPAARGISYVEAAATEWSSSSDEIVVEDAKVPVDILNSHARKAFPTRTSPGKRKAPSLVDDQPDMKSWKLQRISSDNLPVNTRAVPSRRQDVDEFRMTPAKRPNVSTRSKSPAKVKTKELRSRKRDVTPVLDGIGVGDISLPPGPDSPAKHTRSHDKGHGKKRGQPARGNSVIKPRPVDNEVKPEPADKAYESSREASVQETEEEGSTESEVEELQQLEGSGAESEVDEHEEEEKERSKIRNYSEQNSPAKRNRGRPKKTAVQDNPVQSESDAPVMEDNPEVSRPEDSHQKVPRQKVSRPSRSLPDDTTTEDNAEASRLASSRPKGSIPEGSRPEVSRPEPSRPTSSRPEASRAGRPVRDSEATEENPEESRPDVSRPRKTRTACQAAEDTVLQGIGEAAQLYGCRSSWATLLLAAKPIVRERIDRKFHRAMKFLDLVKQVRTAYRQLAETDVDEEQRGQYEADITNGITDINAVSLDLDATETGEHASTVQSMYQQALLRLLPMLRLSLSTRYHDVPLERDALGEIITIIDIALRLVDGAAYRHGKGKRHDGSLNQIKREMSVIQKRYSDAKYALDWEISSKQRAEEIAQKRADLEGWQQQEHDRIERSLQQQRDIWKDSLLHTDTREARRLVSKLGIHHETKARPAVPIQDFDPAILDLDNFEFDSDEDLTPPPLSKSSKPIERPPLPRAPTEEIPPPTAEVWTDLEDAALLDGLQKFTGPDRFEQILYSSYGDILLQGDHAKRDVDDLMRRAVWWKQALATTMREARGVGYEWLASVTG